MTYEQLLDRSLQRREEDKPVQDLLDNYDLTIAQWTALGLIYSGETRVTDIARRFRAALAFVTNTVNALERKGWVQRKGHPIDTRAKVIVLNKRNRVRFEQVERELTTVVV